MSSAPITVAARTLWFLPGAFRVARFLGPRYSLRCVLFHDIADYETACTAGLGITMRRRNFEATLRFLKKHYTPVGLQEILEHPNGQGLPPRPVLVTFDDAYASVAEFAAPACQELSIPAVFFVNASCVDNQDLALDNLVCYIANRQGLDRVRLAAVRASGCSRETIRTLPDVFHKFLPAIAPQTRDVFGSVLLELAGASGRDLASQSPLYVTSPQLRRCRDMGIEIGNHTFSHVHCRTLSSENFGSEIQRNQVQLEAISGRPVRSFSVPYGSSKDLTGDLLAYLQSSGHEAIFLSESVANRQIDSRHRFDRISMRAGSDDARFSEIEVMPRIRAMRNQFRDDWRFDDRPGPSDQAKLADAHKQLL